MNHDEAHHGGGHDLSPDLAQIQSMLDLLGEMDRLSMPTTLEARLVSASISASVPRDGVISQVAHGRRVIAWMPSMRAGLAMAASLVVMVSAVWLAMLGRPIPQQGLDPTARLEADVDLLLQVAWEGDSFLARQIESLRTDASVVAESLRHEWDPQAWSFDLESM